MTAQPFPASQLETPNSPSLSSDPRGGELAAAAHSTSVNQGVETLECAVAVNLPYSQTTIGLPRSASDEALTDLLHERALQIRAGYTADKDDLRTIADFVDHIAFHIRDADLAWPRGAKRLRDPAKLQGILRKVGAMTLATIERVKREFPDV